MDKTRSFRKRYGARLSGPGGVALAGATAATTFGSMGLPLGMGPLPPQYPLAFHHLAQTYMHAVWRQGLCHHSSGNSTSSTSSSSASATVALQSWNSADAALQSCSSINTINSSTTDAALQSCSSINTINSSTTDAALQSCSSINTINASTTDAVITGIEKRKKTLTPAERMREYREKLKRNPEVYQRYKQMNALRSRLARMRRTQEQVEKDREKARQRNMKYRTPGAHMPLDLDFVALAADNSALDFSAAGSMTPTPTHLLHAPPALLPQVLQENVSLEDTTFPSSSSEDWEPPVSFEEPSDSL